MDDRWHILLVEDEENLHEILTEMLRLEGFEVTGVQDGQSALEWIKREGLPHIAVIDINLPDMDGLELAEELYSDKGVPVIVMTGFDAPDVVLKSLKHADDYIRKPFDPPELIARVRRVLSRVADFGYARNPIVAISERVKFNYTKNSLIVDGQDVHLTPIESRLLQTLLLHKGQVVDWRTLVGRVWSTGNVYEDTLRVHIHRLRHKLEADPRKPRHILTERGIGYSFHQ